MLDSESDLFMSRLRRFEHLVRIGHYSDAEAIWVLLDPMGRNWPRYNYIPGDAEYSYARFQFIRGTLTEEHIAQVEELARSGKNRFVSRKLHSLRGKWHMEQGRWALGAESLSEAVRMAREVGQRAVTSETKLALAKWYLDQLPDPAHYAQELSTAHVIDNQALAELWLAIGVSSEAKKHALEAYREAWADGEPYVRRDELDKAHALLEQLNEPIPHLPPYDPTKDEKLPWEDELVAAVQKLRAETEAKKAKKNDQ